MLVYTIVGFEWNVVTAELWHLCGLCCRATLHGRLLLIMEDGNDLQSSNPWARTLLITAIGSRGFAGDAFVRRPHFLRNGSACRFFFLLPIPGHGGALIIG